MNKLLLVTLTALLLSFINASYAQIASIIDADITIGGSGGPEVTTSSGDVQIKSGIGGNTTVTFNHMEGRGGNNNGMDYYTVIEGNLTIDEDQIIEIEESSYLIVNGNLTINGTLQYNNSNGSSKDVYLVVLGNITGDGTIIGGNGAHDQPPYASGEITVGGAHKGGSGENIADLDPVVANVLEVAGYDLPVELISFTATPKEDKVHLAWSTASEINASHFEVYSSNNGKSWNLLGTKEASGNSNVQIDYAFTDYTPYNYTSFYKLVQYDFDGKNETFGPLQVSLSNTQTLDMSIFPNPSSDVVNIQVSGMKGSKLEIQVITKEGQIVSSETLDTDAVQSYMHRIGNDKKLKPGFYFIKTKSGLEEKVDKIIIQ